MRKIFVCSPFRGRDGQPSQTNILLARRLMKAVFDAGEAPFVPHLLFPQVLTESKADLDKAFAANLAFLTSCHEIWVWARRIEECSGGMRIEVEGKDQIRWRPRVLWMPPAFVHVEAEGWQAEVNGRAGRVPEKYIARGPVPQAAVAWHAHGPSGRCVRCGSETRLNREGWCIICFADGTPTRVAS